MERELLRLRPDKMKDLLFVREQRKFTNMKTLRKFI